MTKDIDDQSRVRLSLAQFWGIMVAVATATFVVAAGLNTIKSEQAALRSDFALYQQRAESEISSHSARIGRIETDRVETLRDWSSWRAQVNETNVRQDGELRSLNSKVYRQP